MFEIVLATRNEGKIREIKKALSGPNIRILTNKDFSGFPEVCEDGDSFRENATKKALSLARDGDLVLIAGKGHEDYQIVRREIPPFHKSAGQEGSHWLDRRSRDLEEISGMSYKQALAYLYDLERFGIKSGLSNIKRLLELLGNPQQGLKAVHIAGTNGKGSTAVFISSILKSWFP